MISPTEWLLLQCGRVLFETESNNNTKKVGMLTERREKLFIFLFFSKAYLSLNIQMSNAGCAVVPNKLSQREYFSLLSDKWCEMCLQSLPTRGSPRLPVGPPGSDNLHFTARASAAAALVSSSFSFVSHLVTLIYWWGVSSSSCD